MRNAHLLPLAFGLMLTACQEQNRSWVSRPVLSGTEAVCSPWKRLCLWRWTLLELRFRRESRMSPKLGKYKNVSHFRSALVWRRLEAVSKQETRRDLLYGCPKGWRRSTMDIGCCLPWAGMYGNSTENCVASESLTLRKNLSSVISPGRRQKDECIDLIFGACMRRKTYKHNRICWKSRNMVSWYHVQDAMKTHFMTPTKRQYHRNAELYMGRISSALRRA